MTIDLTGKNLHYFKRPVVDKEIYLNSLENLGQTFSSLSIKRVESRNSLNSFSQLLSELTILHHKRFGEVQLRKDLRILGNALRMLSQTDQDISGTIKQITWGINASALTFRSSGELSLLRELCNYLKKIKKKPIIFDIGANKGAWSVEVIENMETFSLHSFEPNALIKAELSHNIKKTMSSASPMAEAHINMMGIGKPGENTLFVSRISNEMASTVLISGESMYKDYTKIQVQMIEGKEYCKAKGIDAIDFIKVDTEGSEYDAIKTFGEYISEGKIRFIQFEYGMASFYGNSSLKIFFESLNERYSIHRILPEGITEGLKYMEEIETFNWSNYLAIRKDELDFLKHFNATNAYMHD